VLLQKYSTQDDIVVGTPYANRELAEVDELLGAFVNTLALRTDLAGDPSFSAALDRAKDAATQAFAHGMAPFAKVVDSLGAVRSAAFTPVYQVHCRA
jgi:non-ribosomal peptide synthetase component F